MPIGNVSRCLLCACLCTFCQMTALTAVAFKPQVLQLLVERFGKGGVPLVCKKCKQVLRRMQALCNSKVANHMLQTMRAFAARDLFIGEARTSGRVHVWPYLQPHVEVGTDFGQNCTQGPSRCCQSQKFPKEDRSITEHIQRFALPRASGLVCVLCQDSLLLQATD